MVKIWINTRQGLKQITIKKTKDKKSYEIIKEKKKIKKAKQKIKEKKKRVIKRRLIKSLRIPKEKIEKGLIKKTKTKKIERILRKQKISKIVINDLLNIPESELNKEYKPLIKTVLNKKELGDFASDSVLNVMVQQDNINKIKWRFELRSTIYDLNGNKIAELNKGSGGDLMELKERMKKGIWKGGHLDYDIDLGNGYVYKIIDKGNINRVETTIIFRS